MNRLKSPIHISVADGHTQSILRYCLVRVPFALQYQPMLKFYVANITHDAYLGQPWLTTGGIAIDWTSGTVRVNSDITIEGIRKSEEQISLMSSCAFKKAMKKDQAFLCIVHPKEPNDDKDDSLSINPKVQDLLAEFSDVFPDDLLKDLPPE